MTQANDSVLVTPGSGATVAQANEKQAEAQAAIQRAHECTEHTKQEHDANLAHCAEIDAAQVARQKDLTFLSRGLDERGKALAQRADELDAREKALLDANELLARKQAAMAEEVEKMERRIAAFRDIH